MRSRWTLCLRDPERLRRYSHGELVTGQRQRRGGAERELHGRRDERVRRRDLQPVVIAALGGPPERARSSIRFSLGRSTTEAEIDETAEIVAAIARRVRRTLFV